MRKICMGAAIASLALAASANAGVLLGVASYAPFTQQGLYAIDSISGAATLIGNTGLVNINGIAFNATNGTLYALTTTADWYKLDVNTGASTLISANTGIIPEGDILIGTSGAYAVNGDAFGSLSLNTGAFGFIGNIGDDVSDLSGLAFDDDGSVLGYAKNGSDEDSLVRINPVTGVASAIGLTGINTASNVGGLTRDVDSGELFLTDGSTLFSVNRVTGAATSIGAHGPLNFSGLASIPAPGAMGLVVACAIVGGRRRR